jgi:curved DNA-binding protein CbpA
MWLKINYKNEEFEYEIFKKNAILVSVIENVIAPVELSDKSIRLSKIYPLFKSKKGNFNNNNYELFFFQYNNPYQILGKINQHGSDQLKKCIYFSCGICSILVFSLNDLIYEEFKSLSLGEPNAYEKWIIRNNLIESIEVQTPNLNGIELPTIIDYSCLSRFLISILDEFTISLKILETKISQNDEYNFNLLTGLSKVVNKFIKELIYLQTLSGEIPESMYTKDINRLKDPLENQIYKQQIVDRLIQINSSISYVSTQTHSGSIPILERRSLIRRHSLLGIGSAINALNRIVDHIEVAFSSINFVEIITTFMKTARPLSGLTGLVHNKKDWYLSNIKTFDCKITNEEMFKKLAYFSSRSGYRESEYSITASLNSVSSGLSLEWSLMTITHEMLHSHVRMILNTIFYGVEDQSEEQTYTSFYNLYRDKISGMEVPNYSLIDSIREVFFTYCIRTQVYGSITLKKEYKQSYKTDGAKFTLPGFEDFYNIFQNEYRNLNEIFVHIFDLHYFYGGRTAKYIPLIWCSWSAVPHINADIRQYILRSLIAIASKIDHDPFERWEMAVSEFKSILTQYDSLIGDIALISKLHEILNDKDLLMKFYFSSFKNSLIVADLVMEVFFSESIKSELWNDDNIMFESDETTGEMEFNYNAPLDFMDIAIKCPIPYLFDRMIKVLNNEIDNNDIERQTILTFLALNSK